MYVFGAILVFVLLFLFCDWHARMVFLARAYPRRYGHGKSWNRAYKHYKSNWSFVERLFWIFLFKESYESKYRFFAYISYLHAILTILTVGCFLVSINLFPDSKFWIYVFIGCSCVGVIRIIYSNSIARGII